MTHIQLSETVNHIVSEYRRQAQKDKIRHDWAGEGIYWELCKRLKFDLTDIWYIRKHESVPENDTHTIIWDSEIQTDHIISAKHRIKIKESDKINKYLDLARGLKKTVEHEDEMHKVLGDF